MVFGVVVDTEKMPSEDSLRNLATRIWKDGNKQWKESTVFIYLPGMDTGMAAYGVAEFRPSGLKEFKIQEVALYGTKWGSSK